MTIKTVVKLGNAKLATPSEPVSNIHAPHITQLIEDMRDTMLATKGAGIAAPQIGINLRIIMFGFESNPRYPNEKPIPLTILINPNFKVLDTTTNEGWEGCLSVPGLRGLVPRYNKIVYTGLTPTGETISRTVSGFHARVFQHEYDHIEGILFPMRLKNMEHFGFEDELEF